MDINGYPWISRDIQGYPGMSMDIHGYQLITNGLSMDISELPDINGLSVYINGLSVDTNGYHWIIYGYPCIIPWWFYGYSWMCHPLVFVQMIVFRDCGQVRGRGAGAGCVILLFLCKWLYFVIIGRCGLRGRGAGAGCVILLFCRQWLYFVIMVRCRVRGRGAGDYIIWHDTMLYNMISSIILYWRYCASSR